MKRGPSKTESAQLLLAAIGGVGSAEDDRGDEPVLVDVVGEVAAPRAARLARELDAARDLDVGQVGLGRDAHAASVGNEAELDRLEVHQAGVGAHVVGAARIVVEARRVMDDRGEVAAIDDHVAADVAQAARAQLVRELPQALVGELGIAAAADDEIALEHAAGDLARGEDVRPEGESRAQEVERGVGGDELHHRGGIDRGAGLVRNDRGPAFDGLDHHGRGGCGNARAHQRFAHRGREVAGE